MKKIYALLLSLVVAMIAAMPVFATTWDPTTGLTLDMTGPKALVVLFLGGAVVMYAIRKITKTANRS